MKKVIFFTESLVTIGGVVRVITNWSNYFISKGYQVENVSVRKGKPYFDLDSDVKFTILNIVFRYKIFKVIDILPNTIKLYKFLKNESNANVIFNKSLYVEPIWILRKLGLIKNINLIYMHHGGSSGFRSFYLSRKGTAHRVKMIFEAFDRVVCLYDDEKNYPSQVYKDKLFFVPNPLTFKKSSIAIENKENVILSLGRVTKAKGIDTLIRAWKIIEKKYSNWHLLVVGDGEDKNEFIKLSEMLCIQNIKFENGTSDIKSYYERSKVFVIPSVSEGFGMTIIEAMACKCCVLSSDTSGGTKLVDSDSGILFQVGDVEGLSRNIESVLLNSNLRNMLATNAYNKVDHFEVNNIARAWDEILE